MEVSDLQLYEYMDISIRNTETWYTTEIISVNQKFVIIALPKDLRNFSISEEVTCKITDGKNTYVFYGEITDVVFKYPQSLVLFIPGQIKKYDKYRKEKRYDVSIFCRFIKLKTSCGIIRNVSLKGVCANTKAYFDKGDEIGLAIYLENDGYIFFEGRVVRKVDYQEYREYGIEFEFFESEHMDRYIQLIEKLENSTITPPKRLENQQQGVEE